MKEWFYIVDGERKGPVPEDALRSSVENGGIPQDTLIWTEEMKDWLPYNQSPLTVSATKSIPPPIPSTVVAPKQASKKSSNGSKILLGILFLILLYLVFKNYSEISEFFTESGIFGRLKVDIESQAFRMVNEKLTEDKEKYRCTSVELVQKEKGSYEGIVKFDNGYKGSIRVTVDKESIYCKWMVNPFQSLFDDSDDEDFAEPYLPSAQSEMNTDRCGGSAICIAANRLFSDADFSLVGDTLIDNAERKFSYRMYKGSFTTTGIDEVLLLLIRAPNQLAHAEGFFHCYACVFDNRLQEMRSKPTQLPVSDGGWFYFPESSGRHFLLLAQESCHQGCDYWLSLYRIDSDKIAELPNAVDFASDECWPTAFDGHSLSFKCFDGESDKVLEWNPAQIAFRSKTTTTESAQHASIGDSLNDMGDKSNALEQYKIALVKSQNRKDSLRSLASISQVNFDLAQYSAAKQYISVYLTISPDNSWAMKLAKEIAEKDR